MNTPQILLAVVGASVLSSLLTATLVGDGSSAPPSSVSSSGIEEQLDDLAVELRELQQQSRSALQLAREPASSPEDDPLASSVDEIVERLTRLLTTIGNVGSQRDIEVARQGNPEPNWGQVSRTADALERDKVATLRTLTLRDPASVLRMFGEPTRIAGLPNGRVMFEYLRDEDGDGFLEGLNLYFLQGLVIDASR